MPLWAVITVAAAFLQNLRSTGQKHLKSAMGTTGATFVRFGFGLPFAFLYLGLLRGFGPDALPSLNWTFIGWALVGGAGQIAANALLIHLFSYRNFAVGTAYSRTEPLQAALFGLLFLSETVTPGVLGAIGVSVVGVMLISVAHTALSARSMVASLVSPNALIGLASGTLFGVAAVAYRAASLSLGGPNFMVQAAVTLCTTILFQTIAMAIWMLWRDRQEIARIVRAWKPALFVGFVGATASFGWFMAMTLQQAAVVKTLAQVEMLFAFASTVLFFREKINGREIAGCALIVAGIVLLLALG